MLYCPRQYNNGIIPFITYIYHAIASTAVHTQTVKYRLQTEHCLGVLGLGLGMNEFGVSRDYKYSCFLENDAGVSRGPWGRPVNRTGNS